MTPSLSSSSLGPARVAIYTRVSQDSRGTARSVTEQEQECRAWADREGWAVDGVWRDNDVSASRYSRKARLGWKGLTGRLDRGREHLLGVEGAVRTDGQLRSATDSGPHQQRGPRRPTGKSAGLAERARPHLMNRGSRVGVNVTTRAATQVIATAVETKASEHALLTVQRPRPAPAGCRPFQTSTFQLGSNCAARDRRRRGGEVALPDTLR